MIIVVAVLCVIACFFARKRGAVSKVTNSCVEYLMVYYSNEIYKQSDVSHATTALMILFHVCNKDLNKVKS